MRILQICFLIGTICAARGLAVSQATSPSELKPASSLTISAAKDSVKSGSPVLIEVTLLNISNHDIVLDRLLSGADCRIDVRDVNGKWPPDTKFGYIHNGHVPVANRDPSILASLSARELFDQSVDVPVKAGQTWKWPIDVGKFYDLSNSGKYTIQVERADVGPTAIAGGTRGSQNPPASVLVKSNTITVTVTP